MDSERFEIESEAWFRAVAEGRLQAASDRPRETWRAAASPQVPRYPEPTGRRLAG